MSLLNLILLQSLPTEESAAAGALGGAFAGGIVAFIMGLIVAFILIIIALYVYMSLAYMAIAKKNKQDTPALAWIPYVGPAIIAYNASDMHWWPFILLGLSFIPWIGIPFGLIFSVFFIIWNWKLLEAVDKPGWWAIFILIFPIYLVFLGVAAWTD